jgi:hypothetical protein
VVIISHHAQQRYPGIFSYIKEKSLRIFFSGTYLLNYPVVPRISFQNAEEAFNGMKQMV